MNAKMSALKAAFEKAGFTDVKTVLASGNVVFNTRAGTDAAVAKRVKKAMADHSDRVFATYVRSIAYLEKMLEDDAFADFKLPANAKRVVTFLSTERSLKLKLPIQKDGVRILKESGNEIYIAYTPHPKGPVFMLLIEKTFSKAVTTRTWDTIKKVVKA
jgi:uncharacterized protein (DUF1697 family)